MILVFTESKEGKLKKAALEAVTYAADLAAKSGDKVTVLHLGENIGSDALAVASAHGADKVINGVKTAFNAEDWSAAIAGTAQAEGAKVVIISNSYTGKAVAPRVAAALKAGIASGVVALPDTTSGFTVKKSAFSGKAFAYVNLTTDVKVLAITPNSYSVKENAKPAEIAELSVPAAASRVEVVEVQTVAGKVPLTEAELVVSGGRGMKGPEHWNMIEELADALGASTACSKPVADMHWRPHEEHVGQTGITIKPNLYIAIGISGAIQHLAGVSSSKVICVINKDAEAPFFKAADYGIVGDAFEVLPKLIDAAKKLKANG